MATIMLTPEVPRWVNPIRFAKERSQLKGVLPLSEFSDVMEVYSALQGSVTFEVGFNKRVMERVCLDGTLTVDLVVPCVRCMQPFQYHTHSTFTLIPVREEEIKTIPPEHDIVVMEEGLVSVYDILKQELLLALPMVMMHSEGTCDSNA